MLTRRTLMGAAAALALALPAAAQDGETLTVPLISKGFQHQFWQAVDRGAQQAADELGVTVSFEGPDNESQVDKQMDMLSAALATDPDAIGFAALDSQAAIPLLRQAQERGIPVVAFDSGVDSDIPVATAATNNMAAASLAADKMAEALGGSGNVAIVAHDQTSRTGIERRDGFVERMESEYPDVNIVAVEYGGGDHLRSTEITRAMLAANPDLDGIFGTNEGSAIGVVNGVRESGAEGITIVGYDSGKAQTDAIRDGLMLGAVTQNPVGIGYETVKAAVAAARGEEVPSEIDTGFYWYDQSNIDDDEIQAVLYE